MNPSPARLQQLIDRKLAGTITRVEMAQLEDALRTPALMDLYLRTTEIEAALQEIHAPAGTAPESTSPTPVAMPPDESRLLIAAAAAITLVLAAGALYSSLRNEFRVGTTSPPSSPSAQSVTVVATITRSIGTQQDPATDLRSGDLIELDSGLVEIEFISGTRLLLEGPARLAITSPSAARLDTGRCVVDTPKFTSSFQLDTDRGKISSSDAEFAVEVSDGKEGMRLGVFDGLTNLRNHADGQRMRLTRQHALQATDTHEFRSVAFPFDSFHRRFPSSELTWSAPVDSFEPVSIDHDLTGLVWGAGHYRAYFKWMNGSDALFIHSSQILFNGTPVASDIHDGLAGDPHHTSKHAYHFSIPDGDYAHGTWTLRSMIQTNPRELSQVQLPEDLLSNQGEVLLADDPRLLIARRKIYRTLQATPDSHGVLLIEPGLASSAADFCGTWSYTHNGHPYQRTFLANGSARFRERGLQKNNFDRSTWSVEDGILTLVIRHPLTGKRQAIERHLLSNKNTLIFLDRPYRNATRTTDKNG